MHEIKKKVLVGPACGQKKKEKKEKFPPSSAASNSLQIF